MQINDLASVDKLWNALEACGCKTQATKVSIAHSTLAILIANSIHVWEMIGNLATWGLTAVSFHSALYM